MRRALPRQRAFGPALALAAALAAASGCDFPVFDPPSLVRTVRILGVKAEPPELAPGESSVVTAVIYDPYAGAATPTVQAWTICTPDPVAGASSCAEAVAGGAGGLEPLLGPSVTVDIPLDALEGSDETSVLAVATHIVCSLGHPEVNGDFARCFPEDPGAGPSDAGTTEFVELPDALEIGVKRITVSDSITPNQNPVLASIDYSIDGQMPIPLGEALLECAPGVMTNGCIAVGSVVGFTVLAAVGSVESYVELVAGVEEMRDETLITSFFATAGRFDSIRAVGEGMVGLEGTNEWFSTPAEGEGPAVAAGDVVRFWFVVRDGRGGTDFLERTIAVVP